VFAQQQWVRLAQRIPVRIHIDEVPPNIDIDFEVGPPAAVPPAAVDSIKRGRLPAAGTVSECACAQLSITPPAPSASKNAQPPSARAGAVEPTDDRPPAPPPR
jgi:hypothetical protein